MTELNADRRDFTELGKAPGDCKTISVAVTVRISPPLVLVAAGCNNSTDTLCSSMFRETVMFLDCFGLTLFLRPDGAATSLSPTVVESASTSSPCDVWDSDGCCGCFAAGIPASGIIGTLVVASRLNAEPSTDKFPGMCSD